MDSAGTRAPLKEVLLHGVGPCTADPPQWLPVLVAHQLEGKSFPLMCQQQSKLNYNGRVYTSYRVGGCASGLSILGEHGGCATGPSRTLCIKATLLSLGGVATTPNTKKQAAKIIARRPINTSQVKEQNKTPEKELNKIDISNLLDAEFKTLVIRMLNELSENLNSRRKDMETIEKNQSEMKDTLTEIKNTLQGITSGVDEIRVSNQRFGR